MLRDFLIALVGISCLTLLACGPRDHSWEYSPSALALLNTATAEIVIYGNPKVPLPENNLAENWEMKFDLAVFGELENFTPSIGIVFELQAQEGSSMEIWLEEDGKTIAYWVGGKTNTYGGSVCFQIALASKTGDEVLSLRSEAKHTLTVAFQGKDGQYTAVKTRKITNFPHQETGQLPSKDSVIFRDLLGCP